MRTLFIAFSLILAASLTFAGDKCGNKCGSTCGAKPDWAYSYSDPHYMPDCAPKPLHEFHELLIPMMEARKSHESAYIREHAGHLYKHSKDVKKSDEWVKDDQKKRYKSAAKDLIKSCDRLRDICFGGTNEAIYNQMKQVEEDFVRLTNLCQ
ncbi:hypothetical protein EHM69_04360 [candidate division KSB1 bacterium]|nr:MAG: hypothetical protein EHM69_04360 [candidate division KSB1 bacterium]